MRAHIVCSLLYLKVTSSIDDRVLRLCHSIVYTNRHSQTLCNMWINVKLINTFDIVSFARDSNKCSNFCVSIVAIGISSQMVFPTLAGIKSSRISFQNSFTCIKFIFFINFFLLRLVFLLPRSQHMKISYGLFVLFNGETAILNSGCCWCSWHQRCCCWCWNRFRSIHVTYVW